LRKSIAEQVGISRETGTFSIYEDLSIGTLSEKCDTI